MLKLKFPTHINLHMIFKRLFFVSYIKYLYRPISVFANSIYCSVLCLDKINFWKLTYLQKYFSKYTVLTCCGRPTLFQVRTVDRSSDRWVCACVHITRSTERSTGPHIGRPSFDRLTAPKFLFGTACKRSNNFENRSTRPVDRECINSQTTSFLNMF